MPSIKDQSTGEAGKGLNPKRLAFCREYIKDSNGTQAAIRAGYSEKTANEQASQLLAILSVQQEIGQLLAGLGAEMGWSVERSLMELLATRQRAITLKQPSAEVSALVAVNRMFALDKDNDVSGEKPVEHTSEQMQRYSDMAEAANRDRIKISKERA